MLREPTGGAPLTDEEILIDYLESDQLVQHRAKPVNRARLTGATTLGLWALRVFVLVLGVMVIYTFVAQLGS
ncbi:MAG TPA: hypothetical protein VE983_08435 [Solirubrobacteraceae bacterium]|nr:hypothetical protein [Solirubrobacteraceae bacterium]